MKKEEKCCGNCAFFKHETTDGYGICYRNQEILPYCGNTPCLDYISNEENRHHIAVLIRANRYRRDQHVPSIYRMPDPKEFGKAIDHAVDYLKTFDKL